MKISAIGFFFLLLLGNAAFSDTRYVDVNSTNPVPPFTSWATAATNIQDAVDETASGETVMIADGHYLLSSEILVTNNITLQSVNGPGSTVVDGQGGTRCFNLGNHACILSGLTITNGYAGQFTDGGGGIFCSGPIPIATNCVISGNSAVRSGGGMYYGTANHCIFSGNSSDASGGGMFIGTANNCTISGNSAAGSGGGMQYGTANNCIISGNSADKGGGISQVTANNCAISDNNADTRGGGISGGIASHCTITFNSAFNRDIVTSGGGIYYGLATNCIVWYNKADTGPNLFPSFASNTCSPDVLHGTDGNITNAPLLVSSSHVATNSPCRGTGSVVYSSGTDIDGEAWLDPPSMGCDEYHGSVTGELQITIQCITNFTTGYQVSIQGMIEGALSMHVWDFGDGTLVTNNIYPVHTWTGPGIYALTLTAYNDTYPSGVSVTQWVHVVSREASAIHVAMDGNDADDGTSWATAKATIQAGIDAQLYEGGLVWISNGTYAVTSEIVVAKNILIQSVNGSASTVVDGQGITRCFNLDNHACILSGLTVTNGYVIGDGGGIYCSGSRPTATNCIISGNSATAYGGGMYYGTANNCSISGNSADYGGAMYGGTANNCTISNNSADDGGGIYGVEANNCIISGNSAYLLGGGIANGTANNCIISGNSAGAIDSGGGGGMYYVTANNCVISGNSSEYGGGMYEGTANNCVISGNSSEYGGGMYEGTANNCIVWYNQAPSGSNLFSTKTVSTCSPETTHGWNHNITNAPMFMNASTWNFRLQSTSPCINSGWNGYVSGTNDLDGKPRIIDGTVDMGAYESFCVTNAYTSDSGFALEWMSLPAGWSSVVMYSTNLVTMPFTDLSAPMPYPVNSYTDTVHGAEVQCFYTIEMVP